MFGVQVCISVSFYDQCNGIVGATKF